MSRKLRSVLAAGAVTTLAALSLAVAVSTAGAAGTPTATFTKVSEWGSGFEGRYTIVNGGTTTLSTWQVSFTLPAGTTISSHWDATRSGSGQQVVFGNVGWNGNVAPGASVTFGFIGVGSGSPSGCLLNGQPCAGGTQPSPSASSPRPPSPSASPSRPPSPSASPSRPPSPSPSASPNPGTPVAANGQLRVCGRQLCNKNGKAIQLRGMSTHGIQWYSSCATAASLSVLASEWQADVLRISMYIQEGGYETDPRRYTDMVHNYIELATARGMYAVVDWHMLDPGDPNYNLARAKTFFTEIAQRHANKVNVLYEIANEPSGVNWSSIKSYADQLIPVIRAQDAEAVVLVGTPDWSSLGVSGSGGGVSTIAANPVAAGNVMYVFHFYAASHGDAYYNTFAQAIDTLPMFVTEFGTQEYTGDGPNNFTMSQRYLDLMAVKKVSWTNWNFSDDFRSGAVFTSGTCSAGAFSGTARLKPAGAWVRDRIRTPDDF